MYPTGTERALYLLPFGFQGRPDKEHLSYIMRVLLTEMLRRRAESTLSGTGNVPPRHIDVPPRYTQVPLRHMQIPLRYTDIPHRYHDVPGRCWVKPERYIDSSGHNPL